MAMDGRNAAMPPPLGSKVEWQRPLCCGFLSRRPVRDVRLKFTRAGVFISSIKMDAGYG